LFKYLPYHIIALFIISFYCSSLKGQEENRPDTALILKDSVKIDSLSLKKKDQPFDSKVDYQADDSIRFSLGSKRIYMYKNSSIKYGNVELNSERVDFDMEKNVVFAVGVNDSTGQYIGKPHFKQGSEEFDAKDLSYNFKSKKGVIHDIVSDQDGGFLHAEKTKRQANGDITLIHGKYTTCDNEEHPHFYLALSKAVMKPGDQIVSGPAYIVMEDIPLPIGIPFGFFPSKKESNASGILIPTYGEESQRGFFLRGGGYYFALSDYFDLSLTSEIYSKGSWGIAGASRYTKRYKYNGGFNLQYKQNKLGEDEKNQLKSTDFSIQWNHSQAAQANPYQRFSANVNYSSTKFDQNHSYTDAKKLLNNQKQSSISFSKSWPNNSPVNLSVNLRHSQNSNTEKVSLTLPSVAFNVNRIYLFRGKNGSSGKWYDDFAISYTSSLENRIEAHEDSLFTPKTLENMVSGFKHSIPFGTSFKIWKKVNLNLSPSLSYSGMVYNKYIVRDDAAKFYYDEENDTMYLSYSKERTLQKLQYAHGFSPSLSLSAQPTVYGMFNFKKTSKIQAIRHVFKPSASVSFVPSLKGLAPDYYRLYKNSQDKYVKYSMFEKNIYGTPASTNTKSGSLTLSAFNNIEMKVKSAKDTVTGTRKIKIIDNLSFGTSYDIFADSMGWRPVSISASTPIYKEMTINVSGSMDLYGYEKTILNGRETYSRVNDFEFKRTGKIGRLTSLSVSTGYQFKSKQGDKKETEKNKPGIVNEYDYFDIPWSFSIDYDFSYTRQFDKSEFIQSLRFNGDLSLTPKWKINFTSGYDFKAKEFSYTTIGMERDLHCWVMSFNCSPFGTTKFYSFQINVRSAMLKDIKYDKRKSSYDYQ